MRWPSAITLYTSLLLSYQCAQPQQTAFAPLHGTINVVVANNNAVVLVTDSMLSANGESKMYGQKLFKVDDKSFVTLAGQYIDAVPENDLSDHAGLVVPELIKQFIAYGGMPSRYTLEQKIDALSDSVSASLQIVSTWYELSKLPPVNMPTILTIAGYEKGLPTIIQKILMPMLTDGQTSIRVINGCTKQGGDELLGCTAGMPEIADQILHDPASVPTDPIIKEWNKAKISNKGASLDVIQLIELASDAAQRTATAHPNEVGGVLQFGILGPKGELTGFEPIGTHFDVRAIRVHAFHDIYVGNNPGTPKFRRIQAIGLQGKDIAGLVSDSSINNSTQSLDKILFVNTSFEDCRLLYDGSPIVLFDKSNKVTGATTLDLGEKVRPDNPFVQKIKNEFPNIEVRPYGKWPHTDPRDQ